MEKKFNEITNEIAVYRTDKKLLGFSDKFNTADVKNYSRIHAQGDEIEGERKYSNIGVYAWDYSTGKDTIMTDFNISPEEAQYLFSQLQMLQVWQATHAVQKSQLSIMQMLKKLIRFQDSKFDDEPKVDDVMFEFSSDKIFGDPDKDGLCQMKKLRFIRQTVDKRSGELLKYPWYVEIDNGKAKKVTNAKGGAYAQSGSYKSLKKVFVRISDLDLYKLLCRVNSFITVWETAVGCRLVVEGKKIYDVKTAEDKAKRAKNVN